MSSSELGESDNDDVINYLGFWTFRNYCSICLNNAKADDILIVDLQDGSYSRGPVDIPIGEDDSKYYISPTFKFEQVSLA